MYCKSRVKQRWSSFATRVQSEGEIVGRLFATEARSTVEWSGWDLLPNSQITESEEPALE